MAPWSKHKQSATESNREVPVSQRSGKSRPLARRLPEHIKAHLAATISEFVGTFLFLFVSRLFLTDSRFS